MKHATDNFIPAVVEGLDQFNTNSKPYVMYDLY